MKHKPFIAIDADEDNVFTSLEALNAAGYVWDSSYPKGFFVKPDDKAEYAQQIRKIQVLSSAVDGKRRPRNFANIESAADYIKSEGWVNTGVSDDGVTRFDGIRYQLCDMSRFFNAHNALRKAVMTAARS